MTFELTANNTYDDNTSKVWHIELDYGLGRGILHSDGGNILCRLPDGTDELVSPCGNFVEDIMALYGQHSCWDLQYSRLPDTGTAAATLGRKGGSAKTEAKAAAARENGRKGGRPKTKTFTGR